MIYFATAGTKEELEAITTVKPPKLLLSYFYWKNKSLKEFIKIIGYKPQIMLDSGAYTALTRKRTIDIDKYIQYIKENEEYINCYVNLDIIGSCIKSFDNYKYMKDKGMKPIPVFHYGDNTAWLEEYLKDTNDIALGGTVLIKSKEAVGSWVNLLNLKYPGVNFHLLGSTSKKILNGCPNLYSCDSSTWIMMAINGHPEYIKDKTQRAIYQLKNISALLG